MITYSQLMNNIYFNQEIKGQNKIKVTDICNEHTTKIFKKSDFMILIY
jgi:hypothetical protein